MQETNEPLPEEQEEKTADGGACDGRRREDVNDAPINGSMSVFEQVGWEGKSTKFLQAYPIAKDFFRSNRQAYSRQQGVVSR